MDVARNHHLHQQGSKFKVNRRENLGTSDLTAKAVGAALRSEEYANEATAAALETTGWAESTAVSSKSAYFSRQRVRQWGPSPSESSVCTSPRSISPARIALRLAIEPSLRLNKQRILQTKYLQLLLSASYKTRISGPDEAGEFLTLASSSHQSETCQKSGWPPRRSP